MILFTVLIAIVGTVSFGQEVVAKGQTFSTLGDYKIAALDNTLSIQGKDCRAYKISYENTPMEVTVVVCKNRKCKKYVVLSDKLSVQYICNGQYFGVERLDKILEQEGYKTSDETLNKVEYYHQKVLSQGSQGELESTKLIASYFPFLIKPEDGISASR